MSRDCKLLPPTPEDGEIVVQGVRLRVLPPHRKPRAHLAPRHGPLGLR